MEMDQIQHKYVDVRGLKLHVAEIGSGPVVVFLHGFPEIWYSWRYQMIAVANAGYRAIAPDLRGYGLSEQPPEPEKASFDDLTADLLAMIDCLGIPKVFLVGKDFGVQPVYTFAILHPERVSGIVTIGVPFIAPGVLRHDLIPKGFYMRRWREPGRAEADFGRFDVKTVLRYIYILFSGSELQVAGDNQEILDLVDPSTPLPPWFTEDDLKAYTSLYEKSGLHFPLQIPYRSWVEVPSAGARIEVPTLVIMGGKDYFLKFPGIEDYFESGKVKDHVSDLEITFLPEGTHFVQEQLPDQVNPLIVAFLNKRT
ncbi:uncharacterized protein LOC131226269 [Magnolia sinica]|uniref:uncharacterized protein LOC131226269 n=1 Tax=Magnolia sinica TaxID=86752 RepID=UPI00265ABE56|nr:uncharacterized protein LOC131226269 [Magnolia sinica]